MIVTYRKQFLKDLVKYNSTSVYFKIKQIVFEEIPEIESFNQLFQFYNIILLKGSTNRYRIKIGDYRIGIEYDGLTIEFDRFLHRKEFYRYFN